MTAWVFCCILFVAATSSCYGFCQFPPELWCSTPDIAEECQVTNHCQGWTCLSKVDSKPVDVVVYYESYCIECNTFFEEHLKQAVNQVGQIMNLKLVPYGDTEETPNGESWTFICGEGNDQCKSNILQACAIDLHTNMSVQYPLVACILTSNGEPEDNVKQCALELGGINWADIIRCSRQGKGPELEHQMALQTKALEPREDAYLPYVTVNGVCSDGITEQPVTDFINSLCQNYQGPFPYGCRLQISNPAHTCKKNRK
ncbi:hypothetical protein ACJMK2_004522 [Sinanodonta woodiana]|uniref:Gamma-interferon-inducible lysosomal thiol reductase n=1 Tax=Sinanodonta woodiana TaxID=1069815 RepID=A0ABD3Y2T8_SINWO